MKAKALLLLCVLAIAFLEVETFPYALAKPQIKSTTQIAVRDDVKKIKMDFALGI